MTTFIFGALVGGAVTALIIYIIADIKWERYLNRLVKRRKPW